MDKTVEARMHSDILQPHASLESDIDKYETNQGFGDIVQEQNRMNSIKVKQFIPQEQQRRFRNTDHAGLDAAKYEESAGDVTSVKDRVTVYNQSDEFKLKELTSLSSQKMPQRMAKLEQPRSTLPPQLKTNQARQQYMPPAKPATRVSSYQPAKQIRINGLTV